MHEVVDPYKEFSIDLQDENEEPFYSQSGHMELWGHVSSDNAEYGECIKYKLDIRYKESLGKVFSDLISVDINLLNDLLSQEASDFELLSTLFPEISGLMDALLFERKEAECLVGHISSIRKYIDMCNENPGFFHSRWFKLFRNAVYDEERPQGNTDILFLVDESDFQNFNLFHAKEKSELFGIDILKPCTCEGDTAPTNNQPTSDKILVIEKPQTDVAYLYRTLEVLVRDKLMPKLCPICGKYFIPEGRSDTVYCSRQTPNDPAKTCKEYSYGLVRSKRVESNEALYLYNRLYDRKRIKYARKRDEESRLDFENFKKASKEWRDDIKSGTRTEEAFIGWLEKLYDGGKHNGKNR